MKQASTTFAHPSELELHGHLMGALAAERAVVVREHAAGCSRCAAALAALGEAQGDFARSVMPRTLASVEARASRPWPRWRWPLLGAFAAAAAAVVIGLGPREDVLPKGVAFQVFALRGSASAPIPVGGATRLRAGDRIRFVVERPAELSHVLVVGVDAGGGLTVYHPFGKRESAPLPAAPGRVEIPGSIVLDASPGPERIFALYSRAPLPVAQVEPALQDVARGGADRVRREARLPVAVEAQDSVLFEKDPRPP